MSEKRSKRERMLRKIQSLYAKQNGGTPEEIMAALNKARELMAEYTITPEELSAGMAEDTESGLMLIHSHRGAMPEWVMFLASVLGKNMRVKTIVLDSPDDPGVRGLYFFGVGGDCEAAYLAFNFACTAANHYWKKLISEARDRNQSVMDGALVTRRYSSISDLLSNMPSDFDEAPTELHKNSYLMGFGQGIEASFKKQNEETALVLVTPALVQRNFDETFPDASKAEYRTSVNTGYNERGFSDGLYHASTKNALKE